MAFRQMVIKPVKGFQYGIAFPAQYPPADARPPRPRRNERVLPSCRRLEVRLLGLDLPARQPLCLLQSVEVLRR
eukprot:1959836-Pyramimonas_sp.AAC.1